MDNILVYNKLKFFKTIFRFSNEKESRLFFDNELRKSVESYIKSVENESNENIHILYSWSKVLKYFSYSTIILSLLTLLQNLPNLFVLILLSTSLISMLISKFLEKKSLRNLHGKEFAISMLRLNDSYELHKERESIIN